MSNAVGSQEDAIEFQGILISETQDINYIIVNNNLFWWSLSDGIDQKVRLD